MKELAKLIDNLQPPIFPPEFSEQDCLKILKILDIAKQKARPYDGDFKAPWLLSDFASSVWDTTNRGREEYFDGRWKNVWRICWDVPLPNGSRLTDVKYRKLLDCVKKISFLHRLGYFSWNLISPVYWYTSTISLIAFTRWMVLHEEEFLPETYGFKLLDQQAINSFFMTFARGGWTSALRIIERLLSKLYESVYGVECPQHYFDIAYELPEPIIADISRWFSTKGFFIKRKGEILVNRAALAALICEPVSMFKNCHIGQVPIFCTQFESQRRDPVTLRGHQSYLRREKPSQNLRAIAELANSVVTEGAIYSIVKHLALIFKAHCHIPDMVPEPSQISIKTSEKRALLLTRGGCHNFFIPLTVGLDYLNHAMRFVHVFGVALVKYFIDSIKAIPKELKSKYKDNDARRDMDRICFDLGKNNYLVQMDNAVIPVASALGITGFTKLICRNETFYGSLRKQPTLMQVMRVLIGSCIICIAMLKPSRENELTHLKRDCLHLNKDGYHLRFKLGKSNVGEAYDDELRPIPLITAKAIQLVQKLGQGLADVTNDNRKMVNNLFYLPDHTGSYALKADDGLLNMHLDIFCDYVGIAPDHYGRRWYIRIHEMRKWFILLLFWSGRFNVLDSARWIAGHKNANHVYAYIEREFPGEELPKLEAQYSIERLRAIESVGRLDNESDPGLGELYAKVLQHFNVTTLSMVPDAEWADFVTSLRLAAEFVLEPHSIYSQGGEVVGINVSFVIRESS